MTMHHCVATTGQILDMAGPYRVSGEPTVLYFIWFHVDGVKLWDIRYYVVSPVRGWGALYGLDRGPQPVRTTCDHMSES